MSRDYARYARTRISRGLITVLIGVVVLGAGFTIYKIEKIQSASESAQESPRPVTSANRSAATAVKAAATMPATGPATRETGASSVAAAQRVSSLSSASLSGPLEQGKEKMKAGDLLAARTVLNAALLSGAMSAQDTELAKALLGEISETVVVSPRRFADDEFGGTYTVPARDTLLKIAAAHSVTWELLSRLNNVKPEKLRAGQTIKVIQGPFHAIVNKGKFTIEIYLGKPGGEGSLYVTSYRVGLGKDDSTPTGTWTVAPQGKLKNPKFWGTADLPVREAGDPQNPLGEYWIGLKGTDGHAAGQFGYGIHGTIEPDSIGKQASHGCIRLKEPDISLVYEMLVEGKSTVIVKD